MNKDLNEQQRDVINTDGNVLLTACPGSGKTRVLSYKIASEMSKLEGSKKIIVAITFTNRAADEIKIRLGRLDVDTENLFANTIHSFCLEWILKPYASYLPETRNGFVISDEYLSKNIIDALKAENHLDFFTQINTRINPDGSLVEQEYQDIVKEYHQILLENRLIDFDQILYYSYRLISTYPLIAKTLSNIFHLICVDEYQDTQEIQYAVIGEILKSPNSKTTIFLVGDRDQAIYGTLGGVAKTLDEIKTAFGNIDITERKLSGNYRTSQRIIDYYKNFQSTALDITSLAPNSNEQGLLIYNQDISNENLCEHISIIIKKHLDNGVPENEICVLAPWWLIVVPMGRELKKLLPHVNFDAYGLSPLNGNKENVWFRIARLFLSTPSPNMYLTRVRWAKELIDELDTAGIHLYSTEDFRHKLLLKTINSIQSEETEGLKFLEDAFTQLLHQLDINLDMTVYLKQHWDSFFKNLRYNLSKGHYATDVKSFKRLFDQKNGVVVNTCHGVKGEEFKVVIAFGLLQGMIPNFRDPNQEDAAKKLLYVICSRSKEFLYLISETGRTYSSKRHKYLPTYVLASVKYAYD